MSLSFSVTFTQSFKTNLSTETVLQTRKEMEAHVAHGEAHPERLTAEQVSFLPTIREWLQGDDDLLMGNIIKHGMRTALRDEVIRSLGNDRDLGATKFAPALVKVVARG